MHVPSAAVYARDGARVRISPRPECLEGILAVILLSGLPYSSRVMPVEWPRNRGLL